MQTEKNIILLQPPLPRDHIRSYPWWGLLIGTAAGLLTGHPLAMVVYNLQDHLLSGTPLNVCGAIAHSFHLNMWPMILTYGVIGGLSGVFLGRIVQQFKENRLRLDNLHQEFELQVATLRHHYKNLALGIHGFSSRIRRKLGGIEDKFIVCIRENCSSFPDIHKEFEGLAHSAEILEEAAQRLTQILGQELLFLKALTSDLLARTPRDFYPFLVHCVQDLLGLRFREKVVRVEINGLPLEKCQDSLVFAFEPYTLEVILQNILANAMKVSDLVRLRVVEMETRVRLEVQDNGPGVDLEKLRLNLMTSGDRREADSTHLGLRVSLHLLEKCGGRLFAWNTPEGGAAFAVEIPK